MKLFRRKLLLVGFFTLLIIGFQNFANPNAIVNKSAKRYARGRILIQPAEGLDDSQVDQIVSVHGGKAIAKIKQINLHTISVPEGAEEAVAAALSNNPHIKFAEVDGILETQMLTSDPSLSSEWHLQTIGAPGAWDIASGQGITIAILDTGVDGTHPDLAAHMVPGWNFFDNNNNTSDVQGHGTKVAGTAAAIGNNDLGVAGIAWNAKIMPMRISDLNGSITYYSILANALTYAADHGARVANMSYVVSGVASIQSAAQYMQSKGGVVVASAGNSGTYMADANTNSIITVGASDSNDLRASFSAYGPSVDVVAPGVSILTTTAGGGYASVSGTSFSSPLTAGVVAAMLSANPALQPSQIDTILKTTAVDLGDVGRDDYYGNGRVNAAAAVAAAKATLGDASDTIAPVVTISSPGSNAFVKGNVSIIASASDNVRVAGMSIYFDGVLKASSTSAAISTTLNLRKISSGAHTIRVDAKDAVGNIGTKTIQIQN